MSSGEDPHRGGSPPDRGKKTPKKGKTPIRPLRGSGKPGSNVIEFVDSQDPNVKSAIQRHTAYHSAAQRREARLKSLKRGSQSRYLEWGRKPGTEKLSGKSPTSSTSSVSVSPAPSITAGERTSTITQAGTEFVTPASSELQSLSTTPSREAAIQQLTLSTAEDAIFQFCKSLPLIRQYMIGGKRSSDLLAVQQSTTLTGTALTGTDETYVTQHSLNTEIYGRVKSFIRSDEACTYLFLAYGFAMRSRVPNRQDSDSDRHNAQQYFSRGLNIVLNRLQDSAVAISDVNIQAVLLLVSYTSDFGQTGEVDLHADGLRAMVAQRGGINSIVQNSVLRHQLLAIETSRTQHLTLNCETSCSSPFRFPNGFWNKPEG